VDVVSDAGTRGLPGLSYTYPGAAPEQLGLSVDGESLQPVTLASPDAFAPADYLPEAVAFELVPGARVLVLDPGGGLGLLQALAGGAADVTAVVSDPLALEAVSSAAGDFDPYADPRVTVVRQPLRAHLRSGGAQYDLVFLPLTDSYRPVAGGAYSLAETYGLTVEAMDAALDLLAPDGVLVVTRWLQVPPSEELRLFATLVESLDRSGVTEPARALMAYRGIQTMTVLARPGGWPEDLREAVRAFAASRRYDLVWAPDLHSSEVNRYNVMPEPVHEDAFRDLLTAARRNEFYAGYPFAVAPATDDRPFFFNFFRWAQTPQVVASLGRTWQPFGGSGYLVLLALLFLVLGLSVALILAPLLLRRSAMASVNPGLRLRILAYFSLLGVAFLFVEIPLIQRYILLFGRPAFAFTAVVLVILVFSGVGSALSGRYLRARFGPWLASSLALLAALLGPVLLHAALGWPEFLRAVVPLAALAPLSFAMGLPFPGGLAWLNEDAPSLIPWAWAINGCASVIASVLAAIFALSWGFTVVMLMGAAAYALAGLVLTGLPRLAARKAPLPDS
jgi:spermidine synthase